MLLNKDFLWATTKHPELGIFGVVRQGSDVRASFFGDDKSEIVDQIEKEFGDVRQDLRYDSVAEVQNILHQYLDGIVPTNTVIDLGGTDFQKTVWAAIKKIPYGQTCTYSQIAKLIERPEAVRAVANACGANRLALIVPCHRVVGKMRVGGYRWGAQRKIKLLENEQQEAL